MAHQLLTVSEIAARYGISRKRVLQSLSERNLRKKCIEKRGKSRVSMLLIPAHFFADYAPDPIRQTAGKSTKRKQKK